MSDIKSFDKLRLEKYFEMEGGYVCDFSNRTFGECVLENTGVDIYTEEYIGNSGSKASRLRAFWEKESNYLVVKLLKEMIEYWKIQKSSSLLNYKPFNPVLYEECKKVVARLQNMSPIEDVDMLTLDSNKKNFELLVRSIKESIEKNQPEQALDRLHTFVIKYIREVCTRHGILFQKDTPLHSLFGGYIKFLQRGSLIESEMSERILKSSISVLEAFNSVRNSQSLAHDNPILNYNESVLIFNNISNTVRFVKLLEQKILEQDKKGTKEKIVWKDIEFSPEEIEAAGDEYMSIKADIERGK